MSFLVDLDLYKKNVLIIGGGKLSLRKCKQCIREGANVYVLAKDMLADFNDFGIHRLMDSYKASLLKDFDLIIVASDDPYLQKQVIEDAMSQHRFCMGARLEEKATLHPFVGKEYEHFQIGVSTRGQYPSASSYLAEKAGNYLNQEESERLGLLSDLRSLMKEECEESKRSIIANKLLVATIEQLINLKKILKLKKVRILCFHGVKQEEALKTIASFAQTVKPSLVEEGLDCVYLNSKVCEQVNQNRHHIWFVEDYLFILKAFSIQIVLVPMLFQEGKYYQELLKYKDPFTSVQKCLLENEKDQMELFTLIHDAHPEVDLIILRFHGMKEELWQSKVLPYQEPQMVLSMEKDKFALDSLQDKKGLLYPMYILAGTHMKKDIEEKGALVQYLQNQRVEISISKECVLSNLDLQEFLSKKIMR